MSIFQKISLKLEPVLTKTWSPQEPPEIKFGTNYVPGKITFDSPVAEVVISRREILQAVEEDKAKRLLLTYVEEKLQEAGLEMTEEAKACFVNTLFLIMKKVSQKIKEAEG